MKTNAQIGCVGSFLLSSCVYYSARQDTAKAIIECSPSTRRKCTEKLKWRCLDSSQRRLLISTDKYFLYIPPRSVAVIGGKSLTLWKDTTQMSAFIFQFLVREERWEKSGPHSNVYYVEENLLCAKTRLGEISGGNLFPHSGEEKDEHAEENLCRLSLSRARTLSFSISSDTFISLSLHVPPASYHDSVFLFITVIRWEMRCDFIESRISSLSHYIKENWSNYSNETASYLQFHLFLLRFSFFTSIKCHGCLNILLSISLTPTMKASEEEVYLNFVSSRYTQALCSPLL